MTKQVQRRRGTATQHTSFTGAEGEISVNTTNKSAHVHDGVTAGGFELARKDLDNVTTSSVASKVSGGTISTIDINGGTIDGAVIGGTSAAAVTGTTITGTSFVSSGDMTFGDSDKAIFGAGSDLQIYHDGTNSYIKENNGTGHLVVNATNLYLRNSANSSDYLSAVDGGAVTLKYNGISTIATTATGVAVTGDVGATTGTFSGDVTIADKIVHSGDTNTAIRFPAADTVTVETSGAERLRVTSAGDVGIGTSSGTGRLTVADGTTAVLTLRATSAIDPAGRVIGTINFQEPEGTGDGTLTVESSISALREGSDAFNSGGYLTFSTRPFNGSLTERLRIDASGNLGLGVTPSAWSSSAKAFQFGTYGSLYQNASGYPELAFNTYQNTSNSYIYSLSDVATRYSQTNGEHRFFNAPSGTAGNAITFTQAMTLDASGNLGVGVTSPASFAGTVKLVVGSAATTTTPGAVTVYSGTATYGGLYFADGTVGDQLYRGAVEYNHSTDALLLYSAGTERARIDASGNLLVGTTTSPSGSGQIVANAGIYLGGSGSANLLDDYEEGTWTVGFQGATVSAGNLVGRYTKVGQLVFFSYYSQASTISGASGAAAKITGLPFTVNNDATYYLPFYTAHNTFFGGSATAGVEGYPSVGATELRFVTRGTINDAFYVNSATSVYIMVSGFYTTT